MPDGMKTAGSSAKKSKVTLRGINKNHTFTAVFRTKKISVNVTAYPKGAGKVDGSGRYEKNSDVQIAAEEREGYEFKGFYINKKIISKNPFYTLKDVTEDVSITARFVREGDNTFEITSGIANKGGSISPTGKIAIEEHGSITYTFAPDNGYAVQQVAVDGEKIGAVKSYTFEDVTKDHKISVAFAPKEDNEIGAKKDKIISEAEAENIAVAKLERGKDEEEGRYSDVITPETYALMKEEGTLKEALQIPDQNVVGMDDAQSLPDEVSGYDYDKATGLYQLLDITPDEAKEMVTRGDDDLIIRKAYEAGYLSILINNQYITPGKEKESSDIFKDDTTVRNTLEFISGVLTKDDELAILSGNKMAVNLGITRGTDFTEEEKELIAKTGAKVDEYFHVTVMKQRKGEQSQLVTSLSKPVEITLPKPKGTDADCIIRLHDGKAEILKDIDDDPDTITIRTDKFSTYAFGTEKKSGPVLPLLAGGAALILAAAVIAVIIKRRRI